MEPDLVAEVKPSIIECKPGDWVMLNTGLENDVSAQLGVVDKLDSGLVHITVHGLGGVQIELKQESLSHASDEHMPEALKRARYACGGHDCGAIDGAMRSKRHHSDPQASSYPPVHIPPLYGRGAEARKDVLKAVRRELISLEENIGWDKVDKAWKARRAPWVKGLKAPETSECSSEVSLLAGAMADLHEALKTDKLQGLFKRGGNWEVRLCELASDERANNHQALALVWEEMRLGVYRWLEGGSTVTVDEEQGKPGESHNNNNNNNNNNQGPYPGLSQSAFDRLVTASSRRAMAALHAAPIELIDQVPLDKILGPSRGEGLAMIRSLVEQEKEEIKVRAARKVALTKESVPGEEEQPSKPKLQLEALLSSRQPEGEVIPIGDPTKPDEVGQGEDTDMD
jgi:hypothetical protein